VIAEPDEVEEAAKEAEEFALSLPVSERVEAAKEYEQAREALVKLGKRLVTWWGNTLSDRATNDAAFVGIAAFLELLDRAMRYVEAGTEEMDALVTAFEELFTPFFARVLAFRCAIAEKIHEDIPEDVLFGKPEK